eukprot:834578-Alexandrium_andersonii.AAC.1
MGGKRAASASAPEAPATKTPCIMQALQLSKASAELGNTAGSSAASCAMPATPAVVEIHESGPSDQVSAVPAEQPSPNADTLLLSPDSQQKYGTEKDQPSPIPDSESASKDKATCLQQMKDLDAKNLELLNASQASEEEQEPQKHNPKATKFLNQLQEALRAREVGSRTSLGQRFLRSMGPDDLKRHKSLSTGKDRASFRVEWAERETP